MNDLSPEIKRAQPDAPKAGSGSSLGEPLQQPKTEISPNVLRHPSETFPWLPRDEYLHQRDQFVSDFSPSVAQVVGGDPQFAYRDNPEITRTVAVLFSRALFVADYLNKHRPINSTLPITRWSACDIVNSRIKAYTQPVFSLRENEIENWQYLAPADIEQLKLQHIHILFNMNSLGKRVEIIEDVATEGVIEKGTPGDFAQAWIQQEIDEEGVFQEVGMVEEMAHAFYIVQAASNPESLGRFIEETKNYRTHPKDQDEALSPDERPAYVNSSIEHDGDKWKEAFLQRYYPDVKL